MDREIALEILNSIEKNKAFSNIAINEAIKRNPGADAAFIRYLVYGVLENKIYLDYCISRFLSSPIEKVKKNSLNILRMSVFQILKMDSVPDYAAVNEAVELAGKTSEYQDKFINAVLRNVIRNKEKITLPDGRKDPVRRLSVEYSCPKWMIKYLTDSYGLEFTKRYLAASNMTPPLTIRVNRMKTTAKELTESLKKQGFDVEPGRNTDAALNIKGSGLLNTDSFAAGEFSVQDESSMIAVETLNPEPGDTVIDLCSAPGGKAIYTGEIMRNSGKIIACDLYENKLKLVKNAAERHGIENIICMAWDATKENPDFIGKADKVICDVPCSGLGVIRRKPEIKYSKSLRDIKELCGIQYRILSNAVKYLKPGGSLLYSTCTLSPAENQGIIDYFVQKNRKNRYKILAMKQLNPFMNGTDGFFICRLQKTE